ncbi:hypothetical protein CLV91_2558 [Maribacter vaceletii]|uniref:Preprotein translocase subunit SecD n=1 Tax=Maribacter vaceletii TaxID=1206816 RepID=A0A495E672_9FLAO|nr:hypothetical protein [Maribacter vaceletii]RKR12428.1 hypothetical protein CLV91_2558 [Maribacter vaceletii]
MNAKWCVSTLIIILALFGLSQEQTKASNQQILLQFTDVELASETVHDEVLATITKKLQVLGVDTIEIVENDKSQLSIRYYSAIDADSVKEFLTKENQLTLNKEDANSFPLDFPIDELPESYNLIISDLHQQVKEGQNLNGKYAFIVKQDLNKLSRLVVLPSKNTIVFKQLAVVEAAFRNNKNVAIAKYNTSQIIPEVRAGPYENGNS